MRAPIRGVAVAGLAAALVASAVPASAGARHDKTPHAQGAKPAKPAKHESAEHALVHWINVQREQRGLRPLVPSAELTKVAHLHTHEMVDHRKVWHNAKVGKQVTGWLRLGEDVGKAGSVASMEHALLTTPANRVNILGADFRDIGVGTGQSDGSLYVTVLVRQPTPVRHH